MDKMIVVVFDTEEKANQALAAFEELRDEGAIAVYSSAIVVRDAEGRLDLKKSADHGPIGTAVGAVAGGLLGLLGGPLGVAVGASAGSLIGMLRDIHQTGIDIEFINDTAEQLEPGKCALIVEVAEAFTMPVDTRMAALDGTIYRRQRQLVAEEQFNREVNEAMAELDQLRDELEHAADDHRSHVEAKIEVSRRRLRDLESQSSERAAALKSEAQAKVETLKESASKSNEQLKQKYHDWVQCVTDKYEESATKVTDAGKSAKEKADR